MLIIYIILVKMNTGINKKRGQLTWHGFNKYFKYVEEIDVNIKVLCLLCLLTRKTKSTSKKSSTNLKRLIKVGIYNMFYYYLS